ncbi:hypothetical protein IPS70_22275 [Xanthomonas perforans]|nr:hypothetical protein [Xanthomonas perforans]
MTKLNAPFSKLVIYVTQMLLHDPSLKRFAFVVHGADEAPLARSLPYLDFVTSPQLPRQLTCPHRPYQ